MKVRIINRSEVRSLLPMGECIELMAETLKALAQGQALQPLRSALRLPENIGALGMMPAFLASPRTMGVKVISVFPGNVRTGYESHQGTVLLFDTEHGQLLAVIDAGQITAVRTAAVSGVATRLLARSEASNLALLGSGTQACTHLQAMRLVREIKRIRVWGLPLEHAREFAKRESERQGVKIEPMETAQAAVEGADIICTVTSAKEPILFGPWISAGAHINAVGASSPVARELDTETVARSRMYVDKRESILNEAGDFLFPKKEGAVDDSHILGEIGEILVGRIQGRRSEQEITLFEALGLAVEDVASAHHVYNKAVEKGIGICVDWGGGRHGQC
jgi:ornithine cyclodeaminase/alanine dehydrogenase-like protein (mu-crystallin family)